MASYPVLSPSSLCSAVGFLAVPGTHGLCSHRRTFAHAIHCLGYSSFEEPHGSVLHFLKSLLTCYFIRCAFLASLFKKTNHPFHSPIYPVFLSCYIFLCRILDLLSYYCCCCSVTQSYQTLCNPTYCSTPGFLVLHYLLEFAQTHVH